jgi:Mrp family chromosome partitioning ATPase
MENIRQAVERAREARGPDGKDQRLTGSAHRLQRVLSDLIDESVHELNVPHLEAHRIIGYDPADPRSSSYDMLRTQVLRSMESASQKVLAITSPTAGCGKTLTAINLALSIGRQQDRSVLLLDMDMQKGQVAKCLGLKFENGLISVLEERVTLTRALVRIRAGKSNLLVLPTEIGAFGSSDWMTSQAMELFFQQIRRAFPSHVIIVDLPPMLYGDGVIAILPYIDCVLLVAAIGTSTLPEIQVCRKHLQATEMVRFVLNKDRETKSNCYYYTNVDL